MAKKQGLVLGMSVVEGEDSFTLFAAPAAPGQTVTIHDLTVAQMVRVYWGDGNYNHYTGSGARTHVYASAGTFTIRIVNALHITGLNLQSVEPLSFAAGNIGRLKNLASLICNLSNGYIGAGELGGLHKLTQLAPAGTANITISPGEIGGLTNLTLLYLVALPNASVGFGEIGGLSNLATLNLSVIPNVHVAAGEIGGLVNLTWFAVSGTGDVTIGATEIGNLNKLTYVVLQNHPAVAFQTGLANLIACTTIKYENGLSQAQVDNVLSQFYAGFPNRTGVGGLLDLNGFANAAPSGTYQAACPPDTGKEYCYELLNDTCNVSPNHWTTMSMPGGLP